jgi:serine/threonine-protein kinase
MVGSTIGKYHVLDRIGRGGMGTVYRAVDEILHREVAIKVLNSELNDPEIAKRFRAEAVTVARLSHPGIATIYELFQHDGQWMMVMEFVRGETLEHLVERMGALSPQRAAELCMQALTALAHAHSMGVIHRDLKPANLMMTESGAVKIMDFGIARVSGSEHLTSAGFMMGTPAYMAPEQVLGHEVDARADLYALGVVFYRLTTAKLPFKGDTPFAMVQSQVNDPPTPIALLRSDLPTWADQIVQRALAKAPADRFQSAVEFYEAFSRCLAGLPMAATYNPSGPTELLHTPSRPMATGTMAQGTWPGGPTSGAIPPMPTGGQTLPPAYGGEAASRVTASGRTAQPAGPATGATPGPATGAAAPGQATGGTAVPVPPAAPVAAPKRPATGNNNLLSYVLGGAVVVLAIALTAVWIKSHRAVQPIATETPTPTATPTTAVPEPPAATPTPDASASPTVTPSSTTVPPPPGTSPATSPNVAATPTPAATPPPAPATTPATRNTSAAVTPTPTPTTTPPAGRSDARGTTGRQTAGTPAPTPTATASPTPTPTPDAGRAAGAAAPPTEEHLFFSNIKLLSVVGKKATDQDVLVSFGSGQISVTPKGGGTATLTIAYKAVVHGTYVKSRDPRWDASLPAPTEKLDMPGLIRTGRHWLTLQTRIGYTILRLEDDNFERIIQAVETRCGIKVDRVSDK